MENLNFQHKQNAHYLYTMYLSLFLRWNVSNHHKQSPPFLIIYNVILPAFKSQPFEVLTPSSLPPLCSSFITE